MAQENWIKLKIFRLAELLRQETDEDHPLKTSEICDKLEAMGIPCDRRTLVEDIDLLNSQGLEVQRTKVGRSYAFYMEDRSFSVPELKIMIDAVQAASFITEKKTNELIDKIADLGGTHRAKILKDNIVYFNTRKHSNETIYYSVDALERALQEKKKVTFKYFDLNENGERVYRQEGALYIVEPVALVFNNDNYYALVYSDKHEGEVNYRVDRMSNVNVIDEEVSEKALKLKDGVNEYMEQSIKMYGGPSETVELEFDRSLTGVVYDRFGEDTKMTAIDDNKIKATVEVQISPTFWGWLFQFGNRMTILGPEEMVEERQKRVKELLHMEET